MRTNRHPEGKQGYNNLLGAIQSEITQQRQKRAHTIQLGTRLSRPLTIQIIVIS